MADITLTIPPAAEARVIHALCAADYSDDESGANAKLALIDHIKRLVWRIETQEAEAAVSLTPEDGLVT
jgi:hypothetical protein